MKLAIIHPEDGLLMGFEDVDVMPDPMPADRAPGGDGDLQPGRYAWRRQAHGMAFVPVEPISGDEILRDPRQVIAGYEFMKAIEARHPGTFDQESMRWAKYYADTAKKD